MFIKLNKQGVRLGVALVGGVCVSVPLLRCSSVRASAADLVPVALTAEQTLALYGLSFDAQYYNGSSVDTATFEYIGTTYEVSQAAGLGEYTEFTNKNFVDLTRFGASGYITSDSMIRNTNFLIYRWNTIGPVSPTWDFSFQVSLQPSIQISSQGFAQQIYWSKYYDATNQYYLGDWYVMRTKLNIYGASSADMVGSFQPFARSTVEGGEFGSIDFRPVNVTVSGSTMVGQNRPFFGASALVGATTDDNSPQTILIGSEELILNSVDSVQFPTVSDGTNYSDPTQPAVYLLIGCPVLYGDYILPDNGQTDIDLSKIEDLLESQDSSLQHISENSFVHTNQLISILSKLNDIYNAMPDLSGLNVPNLQTAPQIPIDSDIDSRISADLSSGAELLPDISEEFDTQKMQSFSDLLTRVRGWFPSEMITIGGLSLALAFVTWLIFRGRGS